MIDQTEPADRSNRPTPPAIVYKYVVPERLDVLTDANIRFTPPLNTNDIFEVRQTFDMLAGPKMRTLFDEQAKKVDVDTALAGALKDTPFAGLSPKVMKRLYRQLTGRDMEDTLRTTMRGLLDTQLFPLMNAPETIDDLLSRLGGRLLCLSLTERPDSPPMWAHYAANSSGFVIAFDTANPFFRRGDAGERQGLQKISYFDGRIAEALDDPYLALISKQADWAYEREWRLYVTADHVGRVLRVGEDDIHLIDFPRPAVQRVILGTRSPPQLETQIKAVLSAQYPGVPLHRVRADRSAAALVEERLC
jgi:hypothetical protein